MLRKLTVLVLSMFYFACLQQDKINYNNPHKATEVKALYEVSEDKSKDLKSRLNSINKAYQLLKNTSDTLINKVLYKKAVLHYSNKEYDSLLNYNNLLLKNSKNTNSLYYQGKANYLRAFYFDDILFKPDSAFIYYNNSKNNFLQLNDSIEIGKRLLNMSYIQKNNGDYFGSKETITEALGYLLPEKNKKYIASAYNVLAISNKELLNYEDAAYYYQKAINETKFKKDFIIYNNNLGVLYTESKQYQEAINLYKKILKDSIIDDYKNQKNRIIDNLAYAVWLNDKIDVSEIFLDIFESRLQEKDNYGLISSYMHLGEFYMGINNSKSILNFQKVTSFSKMMKRPQAELQALRFLMDLKPNSLNLKNRYIYLNDSLKKQELKVKTQFAKIKYDDKLKNQEIQKLKVLSDNQQLEVSIQKRQKIIYLLLGALSIILALFYVYYLIQKHKREKENEVYRREKHISKRIHDEIANDVSVLANYVANNSNEAQTFSKEVLEDKLESIYSRARDISVDIASINLIEFTKELKNLILQYNTKDVKVITNVDDFEWQNISDFKKIAIYRVVQELLINTKKHSNCKRVTLILNDKKQNRILTYTDNGDGFDRNNIKINGLANAESRIKNIGGTFSFDTSPKNGFKAMLSIRR